MRQLSLFGTRRQDAQPAPRSAASRLVSRRGFRWGACALVGGVAVAAAIWVVQPGTLAVVGEDIRAGFMSATAGAGMTVERIDTSGGERTSTKTIRTATGVQIGMPIFAVDLAAARGRVEAIGWVESATVERRLPSTLHVRIVERKPVAIWQRNQRLVMVDRAGTEIGAEPIGRFADLPIVVGDGALRHMPALLDAMATDPALSRRVRAATWIGGRRWTIHFHNGLEAKLPEREIGAAWARLVREIGEHRLLDEPIAVVDLRLPDRTIVRIRPPEPPADDRT
ncbi:MAG: FtsQ-type POTRA domain-containing protein [Rhodospirillales bacterium]|nr:FtsQ-type POTRA domain-containing protein [Rhodospirillales bacterium]